MSDSTSCSDRCNHHDKHTCQCDTECEVLDDCCADFNTHCQVNVIPDVTTVRKNVSAHANLRDTVVRKNLSVCTTVYHNKDIEVGYIISKCPSSWSEPIMRSRCSSHSINMHVYDIYGYNYRNIYCAFCHNRTIEDIWFWNINENSVLGCPTDINNYLEAYSIKKQAVSLRGKLFRRRFADDGCPQTYSNASVLNACSSYVYPLYICSVIKAFKNPHCAFCNGYDVEALRQDCTDADAGEFLGQGIWQFYASGKSKASTVICPLGQSADEVSKTCRSITCSIGYSINGFKCVLENNTKSINVVGTWDCDEEITFVIFRGDYSTQSCM